MARHSRRVKTEGCGFSRRDFLQLGAGGLAGLTSLNALPSWAGEPAGSGEAKLGKHLIGKLEGPEILIDPAGIPKKFSEAPILAALVKAGKLPPVAQRLPEAPMVIKPLHEIGKYGGIWRRAFTGVADLENGNRICSTDKPIFVDYTGTVAKPCVAKTWKMSDDGKVFTLTFRKGMKWSDGTPFTADDVMFWYEDIYLNKELLPIPPTELTVNGKVGKIEKVDDYTIAFVFPEPYYLFETIVAGDAQIACGPATGAYRPSGIMGLYAPKHYLKNYLPKYVSQDQLQRQVADAKMGSWVSLFRFKFSWCLNPEVPTLTPWKTVNPINTPQWVLERNPYYFAVDTAGNQLPYWDKIVMTLAENLEVLNLRAVAGEYDWQSRHIQLPKLPVLLENQKKGNYKVYLDPGQFGGSAYIAVNLTTTAIPRWPSGCGTLTSGGPCLSASIGTRSTKRTSWAWEHRARRPPMTPCRTVPAPSTEPSGPPSIPRRPTSCWTRSASPRRTARGTGCEPMGRGASASRLPPRRPRSSTSPASPRWRFPPGRRSESRAS